MMLAGIDIGTTSICCTIGDPATGREIVTLRSANDASIPSDRPWERLQDPERIVAEAMRLLAACTERLKGGGVALSAIGISCQMHGIVYTDRSGMACSPLYTWQDGRAALAADSGGGATYAERLAEASGYTVAPGYGLATHYVNVLRGEVPPDAASLCTIGDYLAMRLCGLAAPLTDPSNAAGLGLFALERLDFDRQAVRRAGLDDALLPRVAGERQAVVGRTPEGTPVVCAIGDNQASFLGAVPALGGTLLVNVGTGAQLSAYAERPQANAPLEARPFPGGGYLLVGASLGGGKSYALLERFFRGVCAAFCSGPEAEAGSRSAGEEAEEGRLYERMNRLAGEALEREAADGPPGGRLAVGTQFFGTRLHPDKTGYIAGLTEHNFNPGDLTLGVLRGILDELARFVSLLPKPVREGIAVVAGSGNGLRRNPVLRRLAEQRFGMPLHFAAAAEEAAWGAAIYAGVGAGLFRSAEEALSTMQRSENG